MTLPTGVDPVTIRRNFMTLDRRTTTDGATLTALALAISPIVLDESDGILVADETTGTIVLDEESLS